MAPTTESQLNTPVASHPLGIAALPSIWLGLGWLAGIVLASVVSQSLVAWLALAALAVAGSWAHRREDHRLRLPLLACAALALGGAWHQHRQPVFTPSFIATHNGIGPVTFEGVVVDEPDVRDTTINLRLRADALLLPDAERPMGVHGLVLVRAPRFPEYGYGDRLRVYGELETPPAFESFSYADYLARQDVYSIVRKPAITFVAARQANPAYQALFDFKARALDVIAAIFPDPQASLLAGILLGVETGIPARLKESFQVTGTSHIVAISGFNISILAGIFSSLANRLLGRRRGLPVALGAIAVYTLLVGADASVVRAALMGGLVLIGRSVGRAPVGLSMLLLAAFVMTLIHPLTLWDAGFQLSFFATLGLILYAEGFEAAFMRFASRRFPAEAAERVGPWVAENVLVTFAAQLTTLPIIVYTFQRFSLISFVANVFILPAQPAVMILGGIAMLLGLAWLPLGRVAAWAAWPFVSYTIALVEAFAKVPGASVELGRLSLPAVVAMYAGLFTATWLNARRPDRRPAWWNDLAARWASRALRAALALASLLTWQAVLHRPDGKLHLTFLNVGDGNAILIESPAGRRVLIDGGRSPSMLSDALGRRMPVWDREIDWVVVAAPGEAHTAGLAGVIGQFRVGSALMAGASGEHPADRELLESFAAKEIDVTTAQSGQRLSLGNGVSVEVLAVSEAGATLRVRHDRASILLPIGMDRDTQAYWLTQRLVPPSSVLLLGGPDSARLHTREWIETVSPRAVVMSAAAGRAPEILTPEAQEALLGYTLLRTDRDGWVEFITDGTRLWVRTER